MIDLRTLLPLDEETILKSVKKTNRVLVVHEDTKTGGIAGEIAAILCEKAFGDLDGPVFPRDGAGYAGAVLAAARSSISCRTPTRSCTRRGSWRSTTIGDGACSAFQVAQRTIHPEASRRQGLQTEFRAVARRQTNGR